MEQKPSTGRVVHYVSRGSADGQFPSVCRAAIVTEVVSGNTAARDPERVGLCVLNPTGMFFDQHIKQDEEHKIGGTWHWPERV